MSLTPTENSHLLPLTQANPLPLTTIFTRPSKCTSAIFWGNTLPARGTSCFPEGYLTGGDGTRKFYTHYYSPGVCPQDYNYVATSIQSSGTSGGPPITLAICCPPHVSETPPDGPPGCIHILRASDTSGYWAPVFSSTTSGENLIGSTIPGHPIWIAWGESDLSRFTPASAPVRDLSRLGAITTDMSSATDGIPSSPTSDTSTSSATSQHHSGGQNSDLTTGKAAGIGVGAGIGTIVLILLVIWVSKRYRLTRREKVNEPRKENCGPYENHEAKSIQEARAVEAPDSGLAEAPYDYRPHESDSRVRSELEGSRW